MQLFEEITLSLSNYYVSCGETGFNSKASAIFLINISKLRLFVDSAVWYTGFISLLIAPYKVQVPILFYRGNYIGLCLNYQVLDLRSHVLNVVSSQYIMCFPYLIRLSSFLAKIILSLFNLSESLIALKFTSFGLKKLILLSL